MGIDINTSVNPIDLKSEISKYLFFKYLDVLEPQTPSILMFFKLSLEIILKHIFSPDCSVQQMNIFFYPIKKPQIL